jgi:hypothetical protein
LKRRGGCDVVTLLFVLQILLKIWLAGVVLIWLLIILNCIFWFCYDWRWYFKGELPPRSVAREVRELVKAGRLKDPVEMDIEKVKGADGVTFGVIMKFNGGNTVWLPETAFCRTIRGKFIIIKVNLWADFLMTLFWPGMAVAYVIDIANERSRRRKK